MASLFSNIIKGAFKKLKFQPANPYKKIGLSLLDYKVLKHLPPGKIHSLPLLNHRFYFTSKEEVLHGLHEIFDEEVYKINLPANALILDCGAHIGMSVMYFKHRFPDARVIAFEPDPSNFDLLSRNVHSFQFSQVELKNEAVWIEDTVLQFAGQGNMSSKIATDVATTNTNTMAVKAVRLYNQVQERVHLLKIDIEGAEYTVIKDLEPKLHLVENIFFEYHGSFAENAKLNEILTIFTRNNFSYYIKEAFPVYPNPFVRENKTAPYDVQLNIFCFRKTSDN